MSCLILIKHRREYGEKYAVRVKSNFQANWFLYKVKQFPIIFPNLKVNIKKNEKLTEQTFNQVHHFNFTFN